MIKIKNLHKSFGAKKVLQGIDLNVAHAKTTVVFGKSGVGKSTIIRHIVGLLHPDSGSIDVDGIKVETLGERGLSELRRRIGFLFQSGALFDSMNVFENVAFPLREHLNLSESEIKKRVHESLELVSLKPNDVDKLFPDELSGGMRKRVGLARTIILRPEIMLYDEPTTGLDPITSDEISKLIIKLQEEFHTTGILISHDVKEAFKCADYCAMLWDGKIIEYSDADSFAATSNQIVRDFLEGNASE